MLEIIIPAFECYDEDNSKFISIPTTRILLEHSLLSISAWESKWNKPFIGNNTITDEESIDYIKCMTLNLEDINDLVWNYITDDVMMRVIDYIDAPMTATTFSESNHRKSRAIITNELIYYWMFSLGIDKECEKWHLNRLLTLIRVCSEKNAPKKKMTNKEIFAQNKALNDARRKAWNSKG